MSRHALPLAILMTFTFVGCQAPWRSSENYSEFSGGLEQPDSLIDFPEAIAKYPDTSAEAPESASLVRSADASGADTESPVILASGDLPNAQSSRRILQSMIDEAGDLLRDATEAPESSRDELLIRAMLAYEGVLKKDPGNAVAHHRLGVIGDMQGEFIEAEDHYRAALSKTPHDPDLLSDIGYSYQLQERPEVAEKFLQRALDIDPGHVRAANNLGRLKAERGEYDAAYALFERAGSKSHADRAIAHFFPDGKPDTKPVEEPKPVKQQVADAREQMERAREQLRQEFEPAVDPSLFEPQTLARAENQTASEPTAAGRPAMSETPATIQPQVTPATKPTGGVVNSPIRSFTVAERYVIDQPPAYPERPKTTPPATGVPAVSEEHALFETEPVDLQEFGRDTSGLQPSKPIITAKTPTVKPSPSTISATPAQHPFSGIVNESPQQQVIQQVQQSVLQQVKPALQPVKPLKQVQPVAYEQIRVPAGPPTSWPGLNELESVTPPQTTAPKTVVSPAVEKTPVVTPKSAPIELPKITPRSK